MRIFQTVGTLGDILDDRKIIVYTIKLIKDIGDYYDRL